MVMVMYKVNFVPKMKRGEGGERGLARHPPGFTPLHLVVRIRILPLVLDLMNIYLLNNSDQSRCTFYFKGDKPSKTPTFLFSSVFNRGIQRNWNLTA